MSGADLLELFAPLFLVLLLVLSPMSLVILARIGASGIGTRPVNILIRSAVIAAVFAPGFLVVPSNPRLGIHEMVVPAPFLFALFQADWSHDRAVFGVIPAMLALTLPVAFSWLLLSWIMLHRRRSGWSDDVRSTRSIARFSLLGPILVFAAFSAPLVLFGNVSPFPPMWAGAATIGWSFFLLFLARRPPPASPRLALRIWLVACLALGGFCLILGFGIGIFTG